MDIDKVFHTNIKYVLIPGDIADPVVELTYTGPELQFKEELRKHFARNELNEKAQKSVETQLSSAKTTEAHVTNAMSAILSRSTGQYQIIPITMPSPTNDHVGINAYIDDYGVHKQLAKNARASRILTDEIYGDCFLSKTIDDGEDVWSRNDFLKEDYEAWLANPPSAKGRWDPSMAAQMQNMMDPENKDKSDLVKQLQNMNSGAGSAVENTIPDNECWGCRKVMTRHFKCTRCKKAKYCGNECQKDDWRFHRRICKPTDELTAN